MAERPAVRHDGSWQDVQVLRAESHAPDAIGTMSLSALKSLIEEAGLSHADCLDEADLSARARGALTAGAINPFPARLSERRAPDQRPCMPAFPATTRSYDGLSGTARMPYVPAMLPDRSLAFVPTCVQHTNCCVKTFAESRERVLGSWPQHRHKAGYMASGRVFIHIK